MTHLRRLVVIEVCLSEQYCGLSGRVALRWQARITRSRPDRSTLDHKSLGCPLSRTVVCRLELLGYQCHLFRYEHTLTLSGLTATDPLPPGGDDLRLKVWDIRQGFDQPIIINKRCVVINECPQPEPSAGLGSTPV